MAKIIISQFLKKFCDGVAEFSVNTESIYKLRDEIVNTHKPLAKVIFDSQGQLNGFVNFYINNQRVDFLQDQKLCSNDVVEILVSISGG